MSLLPVVQELVAASANPVAEFAYIDESGNTGDPKKGGTRTYTLGCLLVPMDRWTDRLDVMVEARRAIAKRYGVRMGDELKANYLLRGRGPLQDLRLGDGQRRDIYQGLLGTANLVGSKTFAVVIDKEHPRMAGRDPFDPSWTYLLQRLRIRSENMGHPIIVVHDDGEAVKVRAVLRRFRRFSYAPGGRQVEARLLIEDPIPRASESSYFIQAADLIAYAAFRRIQPPPASRASVCSAAMWDKLEASWMREASRSRADGIVLYP